MVILQFRKAHFAKASAAKFSIEVHNIKKIQRGHKLNFGYHEEFQKVPLIDSRLLIAHLSV